MKKIIIIKGEKQSQALHFVHQNHKTNNLQWFALLILLIWQIGIEANFLKDRKHPLFSHLSKQ